MRVLCGALRRSATTARLFHRYKQPEIAGSRKAPTMKRGKNGASISGAGALIYLGSEWHRRLGFRRWRRMSVLTNRCAVSAEEDSRRVWCANGAQFVRSRLDVTCKSSPLPGRDMFPAALPCSALLPRTQDS
jgi:hypothetical protein